jgi:hypothetical protein
MECDAPQTLPRPRDLPPARRGPDGTSPGDRVDDSGRSHRTLPEVMIETPSRLRHRRLLGDVYTLRGEAQNNEPDNSRVLLALACVEGRRHWSAMGQLGVRRGHRLVGDIRDVCCSDEVRQPRQLGPEERGVAAACDD